MDAKQLVGVSSATLLVLCLVARASLGYPYIGSQEASSSVRDASVESTVSCIDVPDAKELPPPGLACEKELFARRGRPFLFPLRNGIALGVSWSSDNPGKLYLWADNRSGNTLPLLVCCVSTLFDNIEIFDSAGRRVPSTKDQLELKARSEGREAVEVCTCSGWISVAPHSMRIIDSADISQGYTLEPGQYTVSERNPPRVNGPWPQDQGLSDRAPVGLTISIRKDAP